MKTKEWRNLPRDRELSAGPWDHEPDKVQWPDPETGLPCMVRRSPLGVWCGYVGVDESHPWHGQDYNNVDVDVHGGLTYSAPCDGDPDGGICHVPEAGEPDELWWFGFDCGHAFDLVPALRELFQLSSPAAYRDLAYVQAETEHLAHQLSGRC